MESVTPYAHMTPYYARAKMIINAGIKRVVFNLDYHDGQRSKEIFKEAGVDLKIVNSRVETYADM